MKRHSGLIAEINVVPYIDVMLVLLVIFMITAPLLTQGVSVDLPEAQAKEIVNKGREPVIVSIDRDGNYFLNVNSIPDKPLTQKDLLLRVAAELQLAKESKEEIKVLVKGDQNVVYEKVVIAMALLRQAGADTVGLVTKNIESEK